MLSFRFLQNPTDLTDSQFFCQKVDISNGLYRWNRIHRKLKFLKTKHDNPSCLSHCHFFTFFSPSSSICAFHGYHTTSSSLLLFIFGLYFQFALWLCFPHPNCCLYFLCCSETHSVTLKSPLQPLVGKKFNSSNF